MSIGHSLLTEHRRWRFFTHLSSPITYNKVIDIPVIYCNVSCHVAIGPTTRSPRESEREREGARERGSEREREGGRAGGRERQRQSERERGREGGRKGEKSCES